MNVKTSGSKLHGEITAPPSKSVFQRLVVAALLSNEESVIHNYSFCDDARSALEMTNTLGGCIEHSDNTLMIQGGLRPRLFFLNAGESGLGIRLFSSVAALCYKEITVLGIGSLKKRPMGEFETIFNQLGVRISTNNGFLPIKIQGKMKGGEIFIDGSMSSQFLSGLLMSLPLCEENSIIHVANLKSIPYIKMTLAVLEKFGVAIKHDNYKTFTIASKQTYNATETSTPGDWSGAAFLFVASAIHGDSPIKINGLDDEYFQADQKIVSVLKNAGITIKQDGDTYTVSPGVIKGFSFDATHCPDLFPALAVLAAYATTPSSIKGVHRLKHKESDRGLVIQQEMAKAGIEVKIEDDTMTIYPGIIQSCTINSHNDHRIAMMGTVLGLKDTSITIENTGCVNKSYPDFFRDIKALGGEISFVSE